MCIVYSQLPKDVATVGVYSMKAEVFVESNLFGSLPKGYFPKDTLLRISQMIGDFFLCLPVLENRLRYLAQICLSVVCAGDCVKDILQRIVLHHHADGRVDQ